MPRDKRLRLGLVGCGKVGEKRVAAGTARLVKCFDVLPGLATSMAADNGGSASNSLGALLESDDIDVVVVATPHHSLASIALRAVEAGKHVLIEKPGGTSSADLRSVADAADRHGVKVAVGFNHRFHPAVSQALNVVQSGSLGELFYFRGIYGHGGRLGYEKEWRMKPNLSGGGELLDQGVHLIDLALAVLGTMRVVAAITPTFYWKSSVEDNAFLLLEGHQRGVAMLHASWTEWKNTFSFEIAGEKGAVRVEGLGGTYGVERYTHYAMHEDLGPPSTTIYEYPFPDLSWAMELESFFQSLKSESIGMVGASLFDAIAVLEIVEECYRQGVRG